MKGKKALSIFIVLLLGVASSFLLDTFFLQKYNSPKSVAASDNQIKFNQSYYTQIINWQGCWQNGFTKSNFSNFSFLNPSYKCAKIKSPKNWFNNNGGDIDLALKIHLATNPQGTIIVNPGGPGVSGVDFMENLIGNILPNSITNNYNILGFDPRGVGLSSAVKCFNSNTEKDSYLYKTYYNLPNQLSQAMADQKQYIQNCYSLSGDLLNFIDSQSTARDLDLIRALMGEKLLNYIGYSYGTTLGENYISLFPDKVGKIVLDGVVLPNLSNKDNLTNNITQDNITQGIELTKTFNKFIDYCLKSNSCALNNNYNDNNNQNIKTNDLFKNQDQANKQFISFFSNLSNNPLKTSDNRLLTNQAAFLGIVFGLQSFQGWDVLIEALNQAIAQNDGSKLLKLADNYTNRNNDGSYNGNLFEANSIIKCLDNNQRVDDFTKQTKEIATIKKQIPVFYEFYLYPKIECIDLPKSKIIKQLNYSQTTDNKAILIATTGDWITPYIDAVKVHKIMSNSTILLINQSNSHTSYNAKNKCLVNYIDNYFLKNSLPNNNSKCFDE
ncbi:MAG: alpha/beta hydrolase [Bifidobacteriaceae bacterium]|jgi:pimeloyl-ACP methyl ester carboxylesterase|nr:alpha/beta hydrolase [Bifidobacteriaceae bacterium]